MNSKPIIAIDIDDVLAANAAGFIAWSNNKFGTNLTVDDYQENWAEMWKIEHDETERRAHQFHQSDYISTYNILPDALEVLEQLKKRFTLILLTSRRRSIEKLTREWLDKNYPHIFSDCIFCGFFDSLGAAGLQLTKAMHAKHINATYLIDDQLKHIEAAAEAGITGLLFGEYPWNKKDLLPENVNRVKDWRDVLAYFNVTNK